MKMKFYTKPWRHQREALKFLMPRDFGALYTLPGSGKTKVMIDLILNRGFKRVFIITKNRIARRGVWENEIAIHAPEGSIFICNVTTIPVVKRQAHILKNVPRLTTGHDSGIQAVVMICNYDTIWRNPFKKFLLNKWKPDCVICDESHAIKTPGSKCSRMLQLLGRRAAHRYMLTGTPMAQSPLDVYAQYRFMAPQVFGERYEDFKFEYANYRPTGGGYPVLDKKKPFKNLDVLTEKMFSCAFVTEDLDLDLPPEQHITINFSMPKQTQTLYQKLRKKGCALFDDKFVDAENILVQITRMKQLCSGFIPLEDDDGNVTMQRMDHAREEAFADLMDGIPPSEPVVVFARWKKDVARIRSLLRDMGRTSSELTGRTDTSKNWLNGKTQVLIMHIASGAEGLNDLVKARYGIYYTPTSSLAEFIQSKGRLMRPGQIRPVVFYTLHETAPFETMDDLAAQAVREKRSIVDIIMERGRI